MIEMAEGKPPYHEIHPMRAIFMIPSKDPPKFSEEKKWSPDMVDFLARCLIKEAAKRPTASDLLSHPFVKSEVESLKSTGGKSPVLAELVNSCLPLVDDYRAGQHSVQGDDTLVQGSLMATLSQTSVGEETS